MDPELFCGLVRVHARTEPGTGRLVDLRYRPGVECVATYAFGDGADTEWVHARALQRGDLLRPQGRGDRRTARRAAF